MKKNYLLLSGLIFIAVSAFSQGLLNSNQIEKGTPRLTSSEDAPRNKRGSQQKAPPPGATIFLSENFGTGTPTTLPAGWSVTNLSSVSTNRWIWSNTAPGGQYSTSITAINSTTAGNGFMSLPCDLYNTPFPTGGPTAMDTWFTSPSFPIGTGVGAVIVEYQHYARYCCNVSNELVLEVSRDGVNWSVPYNAVSGLQPNTLSANAQLERVNVSADLAFSQNGYIRFRSTGNSHYFWMIDDIFVYEGASNALVLEDYALKFHPQYDISPVYRQLPIVNTPRVLYTGATFNAGSNAQTNVKLRTDVIMDSTMTGAPGTGLAFRDSTLIGNTVASLRRDTVDIVNPFFSFNTGWYNNRIYVTSDSIPQAAPLSTAEYTFALTGDSVVALDRGVFQGSSGPPGYVGGGQDNDAAAALMIIDSAILGTQPSIPVYSISVFVANRTETDGLSISPRIWRFNQAAATLGAAIITPPIGQSPFSTTITTATQGTWVTLPIFPPVSLVPDAYYFGVEQTGGGTNGKELWLGRDVAQEAVMSNLSNVYFLNEPGNARWINPGELLGIRFNGNFTVGLDKPTNTSASFEIYPNPNEGIFNLNIKSTKGSNYIMNVRNSIGQTILSETVVANSNSIQQIDLSTYDKGIYFVSIENGDERLVRKVVVK